MSRASKATAAESIEVEGYEGHFQNMDDGFTVAFEKYTADVDLSPFFKGLPDDRCQCAHWGYVVTGRLTFHTSRGDESFEAGDAYYVGPGHTPVLFAGTEVVEFSPTDELARTMGVVSQNMASTV
ncbi:cupin domain-containing protein [Nocardioides sp. MAHUQ-72]|uniref:cupin domain-containing protein n=1 Tax=unclassified Nocardioides TaxID=2615069 RepID=UPI003623014D